MTAFLMLPSGKVHLVCYRKNCGVPVQSVTTGDAAVTHHSFAQICNAVQKLCNEVESVSSVRGST